MYEFMDGNRPCWYEIGWSEGWDAIMFTISREFLAEHPLPAPSPNSPILKLYEKERGPFKSFQSDPSMGFGFDNALRSSNVHSERLVLLGVIPAIAQITDQPCKQCDGTGILSEDWNVDKRCFHCRGTTKEILRDSQPLDSLLASIRMLLFHLLKTTTADTIKTRQQQLLTVQTSIDKGYCGVSTSFSPVLCEWLTGLSDYQELQDKITMAMQRAYSRMDNPQLVNEYSLDKIRCEINPHLFWLKCPGDACNLGTTFRHADFSRGHEFSSNNVDSAQQQLTLFAGLAAFHDAARESLG